MKKINAAISDASVKKQITGKALHRTAKIFAGYNRRLIWIVLLLAALNFACESPSLKKSSNTETSVVEDKQSRFESDLQTMKTANLKYIFVIRRTDNGGFDGEDKKYLRTNLPTTNRIILSDEEKAFIVGTNYAFPPENLEVLRLRFSVEDYSAVQEKPK